MSTVSIERYLRQESLSGVGVLGQKKLKQSSVLVVGAGGLGCPALPYLVGAGIGKVGIIDDDTISESNLHRQILYSCETIGLSKAKQARDVLSSLNPEVTIRVWNKKLTSALAQELFPQFDLILDGTDSFTSKFLINDAAVLYKKTVLYGAVLGFDGVATVFDATLGPCLRCLYPKPPQGYIPNCSSAGVLGPVAGMIAMVQASEALKLILEIGTPLIGKLKLYDALEQSWQTLSLSKKEDCPCCADPKSISLPEDIKSRAIKAWKPKGEKEVLIDVRETDEWEQFHLDKALNCPLSQILKGEELSLGLFQEKTLLLYCQTGGRSQEAAHLLKKKGYNVIQLEGGLDAL